MLIQRRSQLTIFLQLFLFCFRCKHFCLHFRCLLPFCSWLAAVNAACNCCCNARKKIAKNFSTNKENLKNTWYTRPTVWFFFFFLSQIAPAKYFSTKNKTQKKWQSVSFVFGKLNLFCCILSQSFLLCWHKLVNMAFCCQQKNCKSAAAAAVWKYKYSRADKFSCSLQLPCCYETN